ncbi:MAG: O-antigen polymerase [Verrucomicrobiota bacterium]
MMRPRFSQSWGRGRLGDWNALLVELGLLIYLIPPLFGALLALRRSIPTIHLMLTTPVFIFTLFYGFSSGTRNIFGIYAITFFVAYLINLERLRWGRVILFSLAVLGVTALASFHMLEFRNMGLKKYLEDEAYQDEALRDTLFIDFNLRYLGVVQEVFPERYDYLGFEVLVWAIVKPIPRAIWPGKPEGLSVSIEEATNVEQMSVATTWVGESFLAFGRVGVVATGLTIGLICGFWNRRGSQYASPMQKIIFASGFFAAALSMRSVFWFTTALLPTIALISGDLIYRRFAARNRRSKRVRSKPSFTLPSDSQ